MRHENLLHSELALDGSPSSSIERLGKINLNEQIDVFYKVAKRALDVIGAICGLAVLSPLLLIVSVLIKLESKGPILYTQNRVGKGGQIFKLYKMRSMLVNADQLKEQLQKQNEMSGPAFKMKNDPRITKVGRIIRKYSIDELPQLWNVIRGDMSLVGPRPALIDEVSQWESPYFDRLNVPQGLTCIWQTEGRSNTSFENWMELDLEYVSQKSFLLDLKLIFKTIKVVINGTGAY